MFPDSWLAAGAPRLDAARALESPSVDDRSIVVALDGSAAAERAIPHAMSLARRRRAPLQLLHVRNPVDDAQGLNVCLVDNSKSLSVESRSGAYLKSLAESLRTDGVSVGCATVSGTSVESTLRSYSEPAEMLVMARSGRSTFSRLWRGSVTDSLIGNLSVPLLIVPASSNSLLQPEASSKAGYSRMLMYLDGTSASQRVVEQGRDVAADKAFSKLLRVLPIGSLYSAKRTGSSQAFVMRSNAWQELFQARIDLEQHGIRSKPQLIFDGQAAGAAIVEQARAMRAELIIVAARSRLLPWWLRDSVAEYVVRHATVPVLVVPADQEKVVSRGAHHVDIRSN